MTEDQRKKLLALTSHWREVRFSVKGTDRAKAEKAVAAYAQARGFAGVPQIFWFWNQKDLDAHWPLMGLASVPACEMDQAYLMVTEAVAIRDVLGGTLRHPAWIKALEELLPEVWDLYQVGDKYLLVDRPSEIRIKKGSVEPLWKDTAESLGGKDLRAQKAEALKTYAKARSLPQPKGILWFKNPKELCEAIADHKPLPSLLTALVSTASLRDAEQKDFEALRTLLPKVWGRDGVYYLVDQPKELQYQEGTLHKVCWDGFDVEVQRGNEAPTIKKSRLLK